ncbi:N-alpha-acetyltransferase 30A-like [Diorhabda carinulata]|uniref:N-alpha-acetyltransferase 30A-like n=1 Tax=Diorhabda carinulata TaxID=1163345 RepID=UPI0025A2647A|nr:N-alpha-acetyltransferase 30A-like [Diorhabda carinulata]
MNKTKTKKNKVEKCPSTLNDDLVKDVSNKCILNEKPPELKNGLINGLSNVNDATGCKKNNRRKRNKQKIDTIDNREKEQNCVIKQKEDQSTLEEISSEIVNNVDSKIDPITTLDSNENISCDKPKLKLQAVNATNAQPSSSEVDIGILDSLKIVSLEDKKDDAQLTDNHSLTIKPKIDFIQYESEQQMPMIMKIIQKDLSEPYSIYTYRYFIHNWPKLCFLAMCEDECVGAIVCKLDLHRKVIRRGYIAMLAVDQKYRKLRIGSNLVQMAINEMLLGDADEVVLETEVTNKPALQLYEKLGFVRDKRLFRYYLNGVDALRLKLWLR